MSEAANTSTINIVPVQGIFGPEPDFQLVSLIGPAGSEFTAPISPDQSGLVITDSTIDSSVIGGNSPAAATFTTVTATTGTIEDAPVNATDIANKAYVDATAQGLSFKEPVEAATLGNITLSGLQTIDGYTTLAGDRILVKNQSNATQNGIYIAAASTWSRSPDANTYDDLLAAYMFVLEGTTQAGSAWVNTNQPGGTLGTTNITFTQFSNTATYTAGTGLTLTGYQFSLSNVGTSGTYGSASSVPVFSTNAQGQVSSVTNTAIAIANTQVSGLGTMSTQNANNVAITGGTFSGTTIQGTGITGTTLTATSQFSGPGTGLTGTASGLSIGGNAQTATTAASVSYSLTFNNAGSGAASGTTYNGSIAETISYNTIGAPSTTGTGASGTWGISITGNAGTVTNGLYSTGTYVNPSWLTQISGSIVSGAVASATTSTNLTGGAAGSVPYQTGSGATSFLGLGTSGYVLTAGATAPVYVAQSSLSVGSASTATTATNLGGGAASQIPYQTGSGTTTFLANGTPGQVLTSNGSGAPYWATASAGISVVDDTTTNATRYLTFTSATTGSISTINTSSTKLQYNPSTGGLTMTGPLVTPQVDISTQAVFTPLASNPSASTGLMWYDQGRDALSYYNSAGYEINIGQQVDLNVYNNTGSTLAAGTAVYFPGGSTSGFPNVASAIATSISTSNVVGVLGQAISNGTMGTMVALGGIYNYNTTGMTSGATLYLSPTTAGALTTTQPSSPYYAVRVGYVIVGGSSTGTIFISKSNAYTLGSSIISPISFTAFSTTSNVLQLYGYSSSQIADLLDVYTYNGGTKAFAINAAGAIYAGTWNGSTIGTGYGGTGVTTTPSNGQLLIGNGSGYSVASLTAGTNIAITNGSGSITVASTLQGTAQVTVYTSGSGTYTVPSGTKYLRVEMVGGGSGGAGGGNAGTQGASSGGGNSTFGSILTASGASGGTTSTAGGSASIGAGATGIAMTGNAGAGFWATAILGIYGAGGIGGSGPWGGAGFGGANTGGIAAITNSGAGGGGGGYTSSASLQYTGGGGSAGGYIEAIISSPASSYSYAVGAGGAGGAAGTQGYAGGAGGSGAIIVTAYL